MVSSFEFKKVLFLCPGKSTSPNDPGESFRIEAASLTYQYAFPSPNTDAKCRAEPATHHLVDDFEPATYYAPYYRPAGNISAESRRLVEKVFSTSMEKTAANLPYFDKGPSLGGMANREEFGNLNRILRSRRQQGRSPSKPLLP